MTFLTTKKELNAPQQNESTNPNILAPSNQEILKHEQEEDDLPF